MLNQVIEESLKNQSHIPSADYDEEAELMRILEASKNDIWHINLDTLFFELFLNLKKIF